MVTVHPRLRDDARFYDVRFSIPVERSYKDSDGSQRTWVQRESRHLMVCATCPMNVIHMVLAQHSDAKIHAINHRGGDCGILVQGDLVQLDGVYLTARAT